MRKYFNKWSLLGLAAAFLIWLAAVPSSTIAGIIQAIIPAAVPTANKQGNGSKFQLAGTVAGTGATLCTDASGNATTTGCTSGGGAAGATLFSSTTQAGPSNSAAETSLIGTVTGSTTIAANTFTNGTILEARGQGYFSLPAVADALTIKAKCGTIVLGSATFTPGAGLLTNGTFRVWLMLTGIGTGAGGAFMTNGLVELSGSALTDTTSKVLNTSNVAYNFTTSCAFDLTATWGAAQVGESITGTNVAAWIPGAPVTSVNLQTGAVNTASTAATSSVPSPGKTGNLFFPSDGIYAYLDNGSSLLPWGPIMPLTKPAACATYSTVNPSTSSCADSGAGLFLTVPAANSTNLRMWVASLPAAPYTVTFGFRPLIVSEPNNGGFTVGMALRESVSGKFVSMDYANLTGTASCGNPIVNCSAWQSVYWTNPTTANSVGSTLFLPPGGLYDVFLRINNDNAGHRTFSISRDNANFVTVTSDTPTTFTTVGADQYGFFIDNNSQNTTQGIGTAFHLSVTSP